MADVELTLTNVEKRATDGMKAALIDWGKAFKAEMAQASVPPKESAKAQGEPEPWPAELEVRIDGKPVKAQLLNNEYQIKLNQAAMSAGGLAGVIESGDNFRILNYRLGPVTSAILGTSAGLITGSVLDKAVSPTTRDGKTNWLNPAVKVGASALAVTVLPRFTGEKFAWFLAGSLFVQVALRHTGLGTWISQIVTALSKPFTPGSVAQRQSVATGGQHSVQGQNGANQAMSLMSLAYK